MSTRSQIGFYENKDEKINQNGVFIYRHSDGYPDSNHGVLATLIPFCERFNKGRGLNDTEYALARCVQYMTNKYDSGISTEADSTYSLLGYGIGVGLHGDIEYFYHVSPEEIKVYEVTSENQEKWKVRFVHDINSKKVVA